MDRRNFLAFTATGIGASALSPYHDAFQIKAGSQAPSDTPDTYQLTSRYSGESTRAQFTSSGPSAALPPHIYLHYDTKARRFVKPQDVQPDLAQAKYELNVQLIAFNISQTFREQFGQVDQKRDLQLTL